MLSQSASQGATEVHARMTVVVTSAEATVAHAAMTEAHAVHVASRLLLLSRTTSRKCSRHTGQDIDKRLAPKESAFVVSIPQVIQTLMKFRTD